MQNTEKPGEPPPNPMTAEWLKDRLFGNSPANLRERACMQAVIREANDTTTFSVRREVQ